MDARVGGGAAPPPPVGTDAPVGKGPTPPPPEEKRARPPLPEVMNRRSGMGAAPPAAPPAGQAIPQKAPPGTIDQILEKLEIGNVAFNVPKTMNFHDTAVIQLMLSLKTQTDELKRMIEAAGEKVGERIRVSDRMEARLTGTNFDITAITREEQAVSRSEITEWKWEVKPRSDGHQSLHLTLSVLLNVDGASTPRRIQTFDKVIEVDVAWHQRVASFFEKNWQWLWATVLVPIVIRLWKRWKGSKPDGSQSDV
jgi:hypothetical protein